MFSDYTIHALNDELEKIASRSALGFRRFLALRKLHPDKSKRELFEKVLDELVPLSAFQRRLSQKHGIVSLDFSRKGSIRAHAERKFLKNQLGRKLVGHRLGKDFASGALDRVSAVHNLSPNKKSIAPQVVKKFKEKSSELFSSHDVDRLGSSLAEPAIFPSKRIFNRPLARNPRYLQLQRNKRDRETAKGMLKRMLAGDKPQGIA